MTQKLYTLLRLLLGLFLVLGVLEAASQVVESYQKASEIFTSLASGAVGHALLFTYYWFCK